MLCVCVRESMCASVEQSRPVHLHNQFKAFHFLSLSVPGKAFQEEMGLLCCQVRLQEKTVGERSYLARKWCWNEGVLMCGAASYCLKREERAHSDLAAVVQSLFTQPIFEGVLAGWGKWMRYFWWYFFIDVETHFQYSRQCDVHTLWDCLSQCKPSTHKNMWAALIYNLIQVLCWRFTYFITVLIYWL